jgi:hypothetical protein
MRERCGSCRHAIGSAGRGCALPRRASRHFRNTASARRLPRLGYAVTQPIRASRSAHPGSSKERRSACSLVQPGQRFPKTKSVKDKLRPEWPEVSEVSARAKGPPVDSPGQSELRAPPWVSRPSANKLRRSESRSSPLSPNYFKRVLSSCHSGPTPGALLQTSSSPSRAWR